MADDTSVAAQLLEPLRLEHLGMVAIGYHTADGPGRASAVKQLLARNFKLDVPEHAVADVLAKILASMPQLLAVYPTREAVLQPRSINYPALMFTHIIPVHWRGTCVMDWVTEKRAFSKTRQRKQRGKCRKTQKKHMQKTQIRKRP